jgi:ABC-type antimicrobial peptide transport system permease subunit
MEYSNSEGTMTVGELIKQAFRNLRINKLKSILSMLGITWGIISVVVLASFGNGIREMFRREMTTIGKNIVFVWPGRTSKPFGGYKAGRQVRFEMKDVEAVRLQCPSVAVVLPCARRLFMVKHGVEAREIDIRGVVSETRFLRNIEIEEGRFINRDDVRRNQRFCVLGAEVKEKLFRRDQAVGGTVKIRGMRFKVIGVAKRKDQHIAIVGSEDNDQVYIPVTTHMNILSGSRYLWAIQFRPKSPELANKAIDEVNRTLASIHNFSPADASREFSTTTGAIFFVDFAYFTRVMEMIGIAMTVFFGVAGIITLSIGGVGVMNIMRVAVIERTREIGIRKALGARRRDILFQFLFEALVITFIGGFLGFFISIMLLFGYNQAPLPGTAPRCDLSLGVLLWSVAVMVAVGLIFGIVPARKAASLEPIESLRYELGRK